MSLILATFNSTPANQEEAQPGRDLDYTVKDELIQENYALARTLKQQQQQQQTPPLQQSFSIHETTSA